MKLTHTVQPDGSWVGGCCDEQYPPALPEIKTHITATNIEEVVNLESMAHMCFSDTHANRVKPGYSWLLPGWVLDVMDEMDERFGPRKSEEFYSIGWKVVR